MDEQEQTEAQRKLNPKQESFCQLYATNTEFFGNGVQSYIEVYNPDQTKKNWYDNARSNASQLLTNTNVLARINELIDITLNDAHVDKQLALVVTQNADFGAKVKAIGEYNKVKGRITQKLDVTSKGKRIGGEITPDAEATFDRIFNGTSEQDTPAN